MTHLLRVQMADGISINLPSSISISSSSVCFGIEGHDTLAVSVISMAATDANHSDCFFLKLYLLCSPFSLYDVVIFVFFTVCVCLCVAGGECQRASGWRHPPLCHQRPSDWPDMMKREPSSAPGGHATSGGSSGGSGNSNLRSPSPHRNAYQAGLAALKKATDHLNNAANGGPDPTSKPATLPRPTGRGRMYGSNVHRIKNMFMQMQSPGDEEDGAKVIGIQASCEK